MNDELLFGLYGILPTTGHEVPPDSMVGVYDSWIGSSSTGVAIGATTTPTRVPEPYGDPAGVGFRDRDVSSPSLVRERTLQLETPRQA
jgi:hypothetical protein